jgi:hypothetical protein
VTVEALEDLLGIAITPRVVVDAATWPLLIEPVGPLTMSLPDPLVNGAQTLVPAGAGPVPPAQVVTVLTHVNEGESVLGRLPRQQDLWRAWLDAVAAAPDPATVVPGEADDGLGGFVRALASGPRAVIELAAVPGQRGDESSFALDPVTLVDTVATAVPFARSPAPGVRPAVRVLDGTGAGIESVTELARTLSRAGAEPTIIGNAQSFDVAASSVVYHDERWAEDAAEYALLLGGAAVTLEPVLDSPIDLTIIRGQDSATAETVSPTPGG